jgi:pSer/pThr/pTyr-binding forkhead associated (FHA) protein
MGRNYPWKNGVLQSGKVSHNHAMIRLDGDECVLQDQNSTNGTEVNGVMLEKGSSCLLNTGDVIRIDVNHFEVALIQLTQPE